MIASILSRASIRKYKPQPVPSADLEQIIACAQRAPTGGGLQIYTLMRVTDRDLRAHIARLAGDQAHVRDAPEFFVVCADVHRAQVMVRQRGGEPAHAPLMALLYGMADAMIAASYMAAAAEALGYGICFIGGIQNALDEVARLLALPQGVVPLVGLCIGAPDESPAQRPRLPVDVVVRENRYGQLTPEDIERCYAAMAPASRSGDWYTLLDRYVGAQGVMATRQPIIRQALTQQEFDI